MESLFKGYYQPTPEQFKKLWEEGTFVFDTNVLLNLYRYKKESRDEVLNVIKKIEDRIWIPYQVGLEFHRNRLNVLAEQNSHMDAIKSSIRQSIDSIEKKCKDLDLDKRHSEIETVSFIDRFKDLRDSVLAELSEISPKNLTNDTDEDETLNEISSLFSVVKGSLGTPPKDQKILDEIYKDGDFRADNKIPPSFEDIIEAKKNKGNEKYYSFEGFNYKHGYGDLIVWKQIIEFARENQKKNIIFITDDKKEDWMRIINSHGKKTISARPELVSEILKEASVENFYIYDTKNFLEYSKEYLETDIQDEVIIDIQKVYKFNYKINKNILKNYEELSLYKSSMLKEVFEECILDWLKRRYLEFSPAKSDHFDFIGYGFNAFQALVGIKIIDDNEDVMVVDKYVFDRINEFVLLDNRDIKHRVYEQIHLAIFLNSKNTETISGLSNYFSDLGFKERVLTRFGSKINILMSFGTLDTNIMEIDIYNEYKLFH